jgi:NAD(P)-dependent dehydrogenase (short-subunit alcohol dehydrogenase family)
MDLGLKDRSVLITGGSGGIGDIGLATAHAFAAEGCALHLAARTPEKLRAARDGISRRLRRAGHRARRRPWQDRERATAGYGWP